MVKTYSKWTGVKRQSWVKWRKEHMESSAVIIIDNNSDDSQRVQRGKSGRVYNSKMPNLPQNDKTFGVRGND